jgi:hypothetical protein
MVCKRLSVLFLALLGAATASADRPLVVEGIRRFAKAFPEGVPGLPSSPGLKNLIEFDVKAPLKIKEDIPPERVLNLRLIREVKEGLEGKR